MKLFNKFSWLFVCLLFFSQSLYSQQIFNSSDRWGNIAGECIALIENGTKIYRSSGAFCMQSDCIYEIEGNRVFKSSGAFCSFKDNCLFILEGNRFYESEDFFGRFLGNLIFVLEGNRIYKAINNFARGECLYIVEDNKVYTPFNPSGSMKDTCILIIKEKEISVIALLAVLARRF